MPDASHPSCQGASHNSTTPRNIGEPLKASKPGEFWKHHVGDYRVASRIEDNVMSVLLVRIGTRREVYR